MIWLRSCGAMCVNVRGEVLGKYEVTQGHWKSTDQNTRYAYLVLFREAADLSLPGLAQFR